MVSYAILNSTDGPGGGGGCGTAGMDLIAFKIRSLTRLPPPCTHMHLNQFCYALWTGILYCQL